MDNKKSNRPAQAPDILTKPLPTILDEMKDAQVKTLSDKVDDALRVANEALARVKGLANRMFDRWEMVIIVLAVIYAALMFGLGLSQLINP